MQTNTIKSPMHIWIYVTDIETESQMNIATKTLNAEPSINIWTIDDEDIENVLRVESNSLEEQYIQQILEQEGLSCTPMLH